MSHDDLYARVWDEADYVVPPAENGAFFITTKVLITANQTQVMPHNITLSYMKLFYCRHTVLRILRWKELSAVSTITPVPGDNILRRVMAS